MPKDVDCNFFHFDVPALTVWYKIIFRHFYGYNSANIPDIDEVIFDYCSDINS